MSRLPSASLNQLAPASVTLVKAAASGRDQPPEPPRRDGARPGVLAAYVGIREAIATHGSLDASTRAVCSAEECGYAQALNIRLPQRAGWDKEQLVAILRGDTRGDRSSMRSSLSCARPREITAASRTPGGA